MDAYTFRARLQPPLVTALPLALSVVAFYPDGVSLWTPVWTLFTAGGGAYLLAELGRDSGKKKEAALWRRFGGAPTTQLLCHRGPANPLTLSRIHQRLQQLRPDLFLPSSDEEAANPAAADQVYVAASDYLRDSTRDRNPPPSSSKRTANTASAAISGA